MFATNKKIILLLVASALVLAYVVFSRSGTKSETSVSATNQIQQTDNRFEVQFEKLHETELTGSASLRTGQDTLYVTVSVRGINKGVTHNIHLHEGNCRQGAGGGFNLDPVSGDTDEAISRNTIPWNRFNPTLDHLIMVHRPDGHHALCADIPSIPRLKENS